MDTSKKKILLTGASGAIGQEVIKLLVKNKQYDLTIFSRLSRKNKKLFKPFMKQLTIIEGDLRNKADIDKLTAAYDSVIHLAAIIPPKDTVDPDRTFAVNVGGTRQLIEKIERLNNTAFFVFSSSIAIYGDRIANPYIKVGDPLTIHDTDVYSQSKIAAETIIRSSQLQTCIFRLTAIMGAKNHKMSPLMFHMPLDTKIEIATPLECARAFVNALANKETLANKTFNLGGGKKSRISYRSLLAESFKLYGLGSFDFPEKAFADKNFHCGYYADGDELEQILKFRGEGIAAYFQLLKVSIPRYQKWATYLMRRPIKYFILQQSEPLKAFKSNNLSQMKHFFNEA